jgi:hypothetical protein
LNLVDKILSDEDFKGMSIMLKARFETVVRVPTDSEELKFWLISKTEPLPGIVMVETVTVLREGGCLKGIWYIMMKSVCPYL